MNYSYQSYSQKYYQLFGVPLVIKMPKKCTYRDLYTAICGRLGGALTAWSEAKQQVSEQGELAGCGWLKGKSCQCDFVCV